MYVYIYKTIRKLVWKIRYVLRGAGSFTLTLKGNPNSVAAKKGSVRLNRGDPPRDGSYRRR